MAQDALPKSRIKELGNKQKKGDYFYRFLVMEDDTSGEHWSKEEKTIDAHQALFDNKTEVEYSWIKGAEGKGDKLRVYAPKEGDKKDSGKRPSEYTKEKKAKDAYWKNKEEFEQARVTKNDKKIELQHYQNLLSPFYQEFYKNNENPLSEVIDMLDKKATELYNRHNPEAPAADVTEKPKKAKE